MAETPAITQDTLSAAGFDKEISGLEKRRETMREESAGLSRARQGAFDTITELTGRKIQESEPVREQVAAKAKGVPSLKVDEEKVPNYERPTMDPKAVQESFGMLMAASMLTGAASRTPFYGAMTALTGAMNGFVKQDMAIAKESLAEFDRNVVAIKERNTAKRNEVAAIFKDYANDLQALKTQLELVAAKYDDPIALMTARTKSIGEAQKVIDANIRATDTTVERLLRDKEKGVEALARLEESRARRAEAGSRADERADIARERLAMERDRHESKLNSMRFKDTGSLRKEYLKESKDVSSDLKKVDKILTLADRGGGFSDNQLRQSISEFTKGARGTNAMIASMTNFGTIDERVGGTINRFLAGEYTPDQRGEIVDLFKTIRDKVLKPGLEEQKQRYRFLASRNRLPAEEVVVDEGALPEAPPAPAPAPLPSVSVTPRQ